MVRLYAPLCLHLNQLNLWTQHTRNNCNQRGSLPDDCSAISNYATSNSKNFNSTKLKILSLNCCSLRSPGKRAQFQTLIDEHNPDIICGCE